MVAGLVVASFFRACLFYLAATRAGQVRGARCEARGARREAQGARREVRGARCEAQGARCIVLFLLLRRASLRFGYIIAPRVLCHALFACAVVCARHAVVPCFDAAPRRAAPRRVTPRHVTSQVLHAGMLSSTLRARLSFFEANPSGRILNR